MGEREPVVVDCGDSSCLFAEKRSGMRTNGGCRCFRESLGIDEYRDLVLWVRWMRESNKAAIAQAREEGRREVVEKVEAFAAWYTDPALDDLVRELGAVPLRKT